MGSMHADYRASARNSFTNPGERFHFATNGIYEGFTVVAWNLADAGPAWLTVTRRSRTPRRCRTVAGRSSMGAGT
jgi:hypothetical protein